MTTLASANKFLDGTLNVGLLNINNMATDKVYSAMQDIEDSILGFNLGFLDSITGFLGDLGDLASTIMNAPAKIWNSLKNTWDSIVNRILGSPLIGFARDIMGFLNSLDQLGLKNFLLNELKMGNVALCGNLDTMLAYMTGVDIPDYLMDGLLTGLALDWGNRVCKPYSSSEELNATNKGRLDMLVPYGGEEVKYDTAYDSFLGLSSGYLQNKYLGVGLRDNYELVQETYKTGTPKEFENAIGGYLPAHEKYGFIEEADKKLETYYEPIRGRIKRSLSNNTLAVITSDEEAPTRKLIEDKVDDTFLELTAKKGILLATSTYSRDKKQKLDNLPRSKDALGSFLKKTHEIDRDIIAKYGIGEIEKGIFEKFKAIVKDTRNTDFFDRTHSEGQFRNYDFDKLFEVFTEEEKKFIMTLAPSVLSHRYNGMHPSAEMFINDEVPYAQPKVHVKPGASLKE